MPHTTTWENHGLVVTFRDTVTPEEFIQSKIENISDPRYLSINFLLVDLLDVTTFLITSDTVRYVAKKDQASSYQNPHVKEAIVAKKDIIKGFARMYELSGAGSNWEIEIFEEIDAARRWLGIKSAD